MQVPSGFPTIYVISDSLGETARAVAQAACAQFGVLSPRIVVKRKVKSFEEVRDYLQDLLEEHSEKSQDIPEHPRRLVVFFTLVNGEMRDKVSAFIDDNPEIYGVDLLTRAIDAVAEISGLVPNSSPGALRVADINYFHRVEAMEFTIEHDDGRNPQDLLKADIVLIGVSRTSKTPLSIYLAQHGLHVANIPLDADTNPPAELEKVDKTRLFGLMSTPDVLEGIRSRRLGSAASVAGKYADPEYIYNDLERAREVMRRLGCYVIRTDGKAVEETAQEVMAYYLKHHPAPADVMILAASSHMKK